MNKKNGKVLQMPTVELDLRAQLAKAQEEISVMNTLCAALITEKFGGRTFVSIPMVQHCAGWVVAFQRLLPLGTVRLSVYDKDHKLQVTEQVAAVCEECGKPAVVAAGKDAEGKLIAPRCSDHIPPDSKVAGLDQGIPGDDESEVEVCSECFRKSGAHNLDCSKYQTQ